MHREFDNLVCHVNNKRLLVEVQDTQDALEGNDRAWKDKVKPKMPQYLGLHVFEVTFCDLALQVVLEKANHDIEVRLDRLLKLCRE